MGSYSALVPEPLVVAAAEIGQMLGLGRTRVHMLINDVDFPPPIAELRVGKVWLYADIEAYAARTGRPVYPLAG
jgi:predicted DNA-binding transcriptional regulator AlpA